MPSLPPDRRLGAMMPALGDVVITLIQEPWRGVQGGLQLGFQQRDLSLDGGDVFASHVHASTIVGVVGRGSHHTVESGMRLHGKH
ncbi:MAG TPA: hypothetical protein VMV99_09610 [Rhodanobacter sp.]|nr:hypothetical protein [Rhodanobacter sp.]